MALQQKLRSLGPLGELQGLMHACGREFPVDIPVLALEQAAVGGPQVPVATAAPQFWEALCADSWGPVRGMSRWTVPQLTPGGLCFPLVSGLWWFC